MLQVLPMTTHDLPWQPAPLLSVVIINSMEMFQTFSAAWAPRLPLLKRDYLIHP